MAKLNFTADRVKNFECAPGKQQTIYWDAKIPGLGMRITTGGARSYIFETRLGGKTLRITIGAPRVWTLVKAQEEATRLKVQTDQGLDPRQLKKEQRASQEAANAAAEAAALRDSITLLDVWNVYVAERSSHWSSHHVAAHRKMIQVGGEARKRSPKLTQAGPLAVLSGVRLIDLSTQRIEAWAKAEALARPSSGRLAIRLLKACLNWCAAHPAYSGIVTTNATKSAKVRETLGKPRVKNDLLQREQLGVWFDAVRRIGNPVIAAYLQTLLLTGARREEIAQLRWVDVDFRWQRLLLNDKIEESREVPLTPYVASLLGALPRRNEWVFSSPAAASGRLAEPRIAHNQAVAAAGLPPLTLHGLRRSFATLSEWVEMPAGIAAQIQGHAPQGVREQNYLRRPLDLLRKWHTQIECWILDEANVTFEAVAPRLHVVA